MPKLVKKMSRDFTIVNNKLLRDGNLGASERGLLVTMLSLPDGWKFSIRGLAQILPDGITKISNILNKLESLNYLRRERIYKNGRIANWDYIISDVPMEDVDPDPSNDCNPSENPSFFKKHDQYIEELDTENLNQAKQHIETPHNNKINNNKETNNQGCIDKSLYQSISAPEEKSEINAEKPKKTDVQIDGLNDKSQKAKKYSQDLKDNIDFIKYLINYDDYVYSVFRHNPYIPMEELDEHIESIARTICNENATITICVQEFPHEVVKSVLLKVNIECLERAVESMRMTGNIRNHEKYFISTLFNEINNNHFKSNHEERWSNYVIRRDFGYQP